MQCSEEMHLSWEKTADRWWKVESVGRTSMEAMRPRTVLQSQRSRRSQSRQRRRVEVMLYRMAWTHRTRQQW